jgi:hypothetical protein
MIICLLIASAVKTENTVPILAMKSRNVSVLGHAPPNVLQQLGAAISA